MEVVRTSDTSVYFNEITWHYIYISFEEKLNELTCGEFLRNYVSLFCGMEVESRKTLSRVEYCVNLFIPYDYKSHFNNEANNLHRSCNTIGLHL
jgi:hypothetical protein